MTIDKKYWIAGGIAGVVLLVFLWKKYGKKPVISGGAKDKASPQQNAGDI